MFHASGPEMRSMVFGRRSVDLPDLPAHLRATGVLSGAPHVRSNPLDWRQIVILLGIAG
jgi:hypothetical protein